MIDIYYVLYNIICYKLLSLNVACVFTYSFFIKLGMNPVQNVRIRDVWAHADIGYPCFANL